MMPDPHLRLAGLLLAAGLLPGCAVLNPYNEDTMCPALNDFGQCVSMTEAYEKSLNDVEAPSSASSDGKQDGANPSASDAISSESTGDDAEEDYRRQLYRELGSLLREPVTPLVKPPRVRRVLVMPYEDGALYMPRYVYIMIDGPSWIVNELPERAKDRAELELFSETEK